MIDPEKVQALLDAFDDVRELAPALALEATCASCQGRLLPRRTAYDHGGWLVQCQSCHRSYGPIQRSPSEVLEAAAQGYLTPWTWPEP